MWMICTSGQGPGGSSICMASICRPGAQVATRGCAGQGRFCGAGRAALRARRAYADGHAAARRCASERRAREHPRGDRCLSRCDPKDFAGRGLIETPGRPLRPEPPVFEQPPQHGQIIALFDVFGRVQRYGRDRFPVYYCFCRT